MAGNDIARTGGESVWPLDPVRVNPVAPARVDGHAGVAPLDAVEALTGFGAETAGPDAVGMADQLLAWLSPRPRNPDTLTQGRVVPLLGLAADMLARASADTEGGQQSDLGRLGAAALEQEIRMQQALADRRATLLRS